MKTKKFLTEDILELSYGGEVESLEYVTTETYSKRRWTTGKGLVFKDLSDGKFYIVYYEEGNTEYQDVESFDNAGGYVEGIEVVPVEHTVVKYEVIK